MCSVASWQQLPGGIAKYCFGRRSSVQDCSHRRSSINYTVIEVLFVMLRVYTSPNLAPLLTRADLAMHSGGNRNNGVFNVREMDGVQNSNCGVRKGCSHAECATAVIIMRSRGSARQTKYKKPNCHWDSQLYTASKDVVNKNNLFDSLSHMQQQLLLNNISSCFRDIGL